MGVFTNGGTPYKILLKWMIGGYPFLGNHHISMVKTVVSTVDFPLDLSNELEAQLPVPGASGGANISCRGHLTQRFGKSPLITGS